MAKKKNSSITSDALSVTTILMISKLFGFARQMVLSSTFGAKAHLSAFTSANNIPTLLQSLIIASLLATFIPIYSDINKNDGRKNADRFANKVLTVSVLFTLVLAAVCIFGSELLARIFAPGYNAAMQQLTAHLLRIQAPLLVFTAIYAVCQNYLNAHKKHALAQTIGFPLNAISITCMLLLTDRMGIDAAAWGVLGGTAGQALLLWIFVRRDFRIHPELDLKDKYLRRMLIMMLPALISATVTDVSTAADNIIATIVNPTSGPAALSLAWRLNNLVIGSVIVAATSIVYTRLSLLATNDDMVGFKSMLRSSLMMVASIMAPIVVVACVMNVDIVQLVYQRNEFGPEDTKVTAHAFLYYAPSILGAGIRDILVRGFYAVGDTRTPLINGVITVTINIVLNIVLSQFMGVGGIALATSISYFIGFGITATRMSRKLGGLGLKAMLRDVTKTAFCVGVQIFVTIAASSFMGGMGVLARLVLTTLASLGVYVALGYAINAPGIRPAMGWVGNKLGRGR